MAKKIIDIADIFEIVLKTQTENLHDWEKNCLTSVTKKIFFDVRKKILWRCPLSFKKASQSEYYDNFTHIIVNDIVVLPCPQSGRLDKPGFVLPKNIDTLTITNNFVQIIKPKNLVGISKIIVDVQFEKYYPCIDTDDSSMNTLLCDGLIFKENLIRVVGKRQSYLLFLNFDIDTVYYIPPEMYTPQIIDIAIKNNFFTVKYLADMSFRKFCPQERTQNFYFETELLKKIPKTELIRQLHTHYMYAYRIVDILSPEEILSVIPEITRETINLFIGKEMLSQTFNKYFSKFKVYKLLNSTMIHHGFQFKLGLNIDNKEFKSNIQCDHGFHSWFNPHDWAAYVQSGFDTDADQLCYVSEVTFPSYIKIRIEQNKFKSGEIILGPLEKYNPENNY